MAPTRTPEDLKAQRGLSREPIPAEQIDPDTEARKFQLGDTSTLQDYDRAVYENRQNSYLGK